MKIAYVCHARFPSEKAYAHQISQVCAALVENGHEVELICPAVANSVTGTPRSLYRIAADFPVTALPVTDGLTHPLVPGPLAVHVTNVSYARALRRHFAQNRYDLVYLRSASLLSPSLEAGLPTVLELHTVPSRFQWSFKDAAAHCRLIVALTSPMRDELVARGLPPEKVVVEPDGVDLAAFVGLPSKTDAKAAWTLPTDRPVIAYVGSLKSGHDLPKGVEELIEAAALLRDRAQAFLLWIVGGPLSEVTRLQALATKQGLSGDTIRFEGPVPSAKVPLAMAAADLGVFPAPQSADPFFQRDTSPLKLLEYMAAGLPTVAAALPPVRDLLDESTTRFCEPGDARDLARALDEVLADPSGSAKRAVAAQVRVQDLSWRARMARITRFCIA